MNAQLDRRDVLTALLRSDLSFFIQRTVGTVSPGSDYLHNWHIDAIAHQLHRVAAGEVRRLIITMPPRCLKSISASVAFPAWLLGRNPSCRILAVSYAEGLAEKHARDCQQVLGSNWYRTIFPATQIAPRRSARLDFETSRGGGRFSTTVGGTLTGRGGDIILIDDPHKPEDMGSDVKRKAVLDWYGTTLLSRLNDPQTGAIVLIQQRVHEEDLAGHLLSRGGWEHLNLPAIAEGPEAIDLGPRGVMYRKEGDLLHPKRLPRTVLDAYREDIGSYVFAAQYQQRPAPINGGLVRWEWFKSYSTLPERRPGDQVVQSWDTAAKAAEANDYSVCTTWLVRGNSAWLIDLLRIKLEFPGLRHRVIAEALAHRATRILIEDSGSGTSLIQDLYQAHRLNIIPMRPRDDKATRLLGVTPLIESGRIALPADAPWLADLRHELLLFPNGKHDDQVDSLSQFLTWFARPQTGPLVGSYG